jgi:pimeloyl-ACP methyl ester carboxylesterase
LQAHGHAVFTPTLTGLGERSHLAHPHIGLETHIGDVVNVLFYEDLRDVILVGHSSGGALITAVADRAPERLAHLVYLDAFVPADGQATIDLISPEAKAALEARVAAEGDGWMLPSPQPGSWDDLVRDGWGVTDEADRRWMIERLGPTPFKTFTDPVRCTDPRAAALPRTFIGCVQDPGDPGQTFARFAQAARSEAGWRYRELATGHEAFLTMPRELVDVLLDIGTTPW